MTDITEELMQLDPSLVIHNEGEWSKTKSLYSAFNDAGVECEVGEFLYAMVRILKPENVLETGTHEGIGATYIGLGLKRNAWGHLDTIEFLPHIYSQATQRIKTIGLEYQVTCHFGDARLFTPKEGIKYSLILLDTEPETRFAELIRYYDYLNSGGFVFIHDTPRNLCQGNINPDHPTIPSWPFGNLPYKIKQWVKNGELRSIHFPTPRGLIGFYKVHKDDCKWEVNNNAST
jgi:hypothetical protein